MEGMTSELDNPSWSVISERGCEQSGLSHEDARQLVHRLAAEGRHGLCIITDDAAGRMQTARDRKQSSVIPQPT